MFSVATLGVGSFCITKGAVNVWTTIQHRRQLFDLVQRSPYQLKTPHVYKIYMGTMKQQIMYRKEPQNSETFIPDFISDDPNRLVKKIVPLKGPLWIAFGTQLIEWGIFLHIYF